MNTFDRLRAEGFKHHNLVGLIAGLIALLLGAQSATGAESRAKAPRWRAPVETVAPEVIGRPLPTPRPELLPTLVFGVRGYFVDGEAVVEWQTGSAAATVGFRLFRVRGLRSTPVHKGWIAPPWNAPAGSTYRAVDRTVGMDSRQSYVVVERDQNAFEHIHGPFDVEFSGSAEGPTVPGQVAATRRSSGKRDGDPSAPPTRDVIPTDTSTTVAKARVRTTGLHRVTAAELATVLGQTASKVQTFISRGLVAVENQGEPVSWFTNPAADEMLFFATAIDSPYTLDNVYWMTLGQPASVAATMSAGADNAQPGGTFQSLVHSEVDIVPAIATTKFEGVDYWYWEAVRAEDETENRKAFPLASPDVTSTGGQAQLTVRLAGGTKGTGFRYHWAFIFVNGVEVGNIIWLGLFTMEQTLTFDASLLTADNTIEVEARLFPGSIGSTFYIDSFDLTYPRDYQAEGDELLLTGESNPVVTVEGLSGSDIVVVNLEDPAQPVICGDVLIEADAGAFRVSFTPNAPEARHLVTTLSAVHSVVALEADRVYSDPWQSTAGHDYVVIVPAALRGPASRLMAHRELQGLDPYLLVLEDLHDYFADGIADPWAIRDFLAWADVNWVVAPRYVFLVGNGTIDPKNYLGYGDNLITPVLAATPYGMAAADNLLADIDGDRIPDFAIGRLPALTEEDFDAYVTKLINFEEATGAWLDEAMMLADNPDVAGDFTVLSESAIGHLPGGMTVSRVYLEDLDVTTARSSMFDRWASGARIVNYIGHGGVNVFASESLLTGDDMPLMANTGTPAVVSALSCVVGRFELPGLDALSESLLGVLDGGAIAMWAPTSPSYAVAAQGLNEIYFDELSIPGQRVGDATLAAIQASAPGTFEFLLETFTLLGDPALQVR
jgi:hypothetical protein